MLDHSNTHCLSAMPFLRSAMSIVNGKWKLPILMALRSGVRRFRDLERSIPGISSKVLAKELKDLEGQLLLKRTVYPGPPVGVEYEALPYAETLDPVIFMLRDWGRQHQQRLDETELATEK